MPETNPIFRPSKTRRLVSAWTVLQDREALLTRLRPYDDLFDQVILMCGRPAGGGALPGDWPLDDRIRLRRELSAMGISMLNDYASDHQLYAEFRDNPRAIEACIAAMVDECERTGADGVDIDFEKWPRQGRFLYTDFIGALAAELHRRGRMLSICAYPATSAAMREVGLGFIDPARLVPYVDHYCAMVYDLYCPPSPYVGPTSTAPWGRETMEYLSRIIPRNQLVMGLPTYSVDWDINDPAKSRQVNDAAFIAARETDSPIGRGWCYYWDVNLIRYADAGGHAHLLWVSDARSTVSHLQTVDADDLAGVCFWVMSGDEDAGIWEAVRRHFQR